LAVSPRPLPRPATLLSNYGFKFALEAGRRGDWDNAKRLATQDSAVAVDIIEWQRLRAGRGSFVDYQRFLDRNADWPGLKLLRKRGERAMTATASPAEVIAYFEPEPPQTGTGALRLIAALSAAGQSTKAEAELRRAWTTMELTASEEERFLDVHGDALKPLHSARLDDALWRGEREGARRMLRFVGDDLKALANARMALQARSGNADALWKAVPDALAGDGGLAKDRMRWLIAKKRRSDAGDLIIAQSTSAARLGRPGEWGHWRRILARQAMRDGAPRRAYALASQHFIAEGSDKADLEWLSGYVALRYRDDPTQALTHFRRFRAEIYTPISLGRAGYWEGRALEEMGEAEAAAAAYRDAAQHQTSFYRLMAAERAGIQMDPALTGAEGLQPWQSTSFAQTSVFQAAQLWARSGQQYQYEVARFLRHLSEITAEDELVALGDYTLELGNPYVSVRVAKQIAREGAVAVRAYYPLTDLGLDALPVEEALALSIARRESEFYPLAKSGVGALGLMQLMPGTARDMANKKGLPYSKGRLTSDPVYNVILGSAYLDHLMDEFGKNITLISVGYNAGPHRARTWSERFGDPRGGQVDIVDWIEHIPFNETRNYVMRVAESLPVYRARLTGQVQPIRLTAELTGR
jgi:soluble lytic murein transglycosylase